MADWMDSYGTAASSAPAVAEKPAEPVSAPPAPTGDWMDGYRPAPNPNLALKASQDIPPDKAAQVLKLQDQTGLPTHVIAPNVEDVQARQNQQTLSPDFIADHPKTAELVGSDPHWAALLKDDIPGVGYMERQLNYLSNASIRSELELERTYHGLKAVTGLGGPDNLDRVNQIDKQLQTDFAPPAGASPVTQVFGKTSEVAVPYVAPLALGAMGGTAGAVGMATAFAGMELSNSYLDFKKMRDKDGQPIHDDLARGAAGISAAVTFALSFVPGLGKAAEEIPGLKMLQREGMSGILESPTLRSSMVDLLKKVGVSSLKMGVFSGGSTLGHVAAGTLAQLQSDGSLETMSPGSILSAIASPENMARVEKMTEAGLATGGAIEAGMGGWKVWTDFSKANDALNHATAVQNVGNAMKNTKAFDIAPDQVPKVMDRLAGDGNKYIPLAKWQEWAETQKVDPRAAWAEANGNTQAYDEALKTGTDLQMSAKNYFSKIAASDHNDFFSKVIRSSPEAMNAEEAEGFLGKQSPEKEAARAAAYKIKEAVAPTPPAAESTAMTVPEPLPAKETEPITPAPQSPQETAAEQHIQAAQQDLGHKPLDLKGLGLNPEQEAGISAAEELAHGDEQEKMVQVITDKQRRQETKQWMEEREKIQSQVSEEVLARPEQAAIATLRTGIAPDNTEMPIKLSKADIKSDFPEVDISKLPKGVTVGSQKATSEEVQTYAEELKKRDQSNFDYDSKKQGILKTAIGTSALISARPRTFWMN